MAQPVFAPLDARTERPQAMDAKRILVLALLACCLGGLYLGFAWRRYQVAAENEALRLAKMAESLMHVEHIAPLTDLVQPGLQADKELVEQSLVRLVETTDAIYYAYIIKQENSRVFVIADSARASSGTYQKTMNSCEENAEINYMPFVTGESILGEFSSSSCGDWIRVLVPIISEDEVVAALGLSYSTAEWKAGLWDRMVPDILIVMCLLLLVFLLIYLRQKHLQLEESSSKLALREVLYRNIHDQAPIGIILQETKELEDEVEYLSINPAAEAILGLRSEELQEVKWPDLVFPEDLCRELPQFEQLLAGELNSYSSEKRLIRSDGDSIWVNTTLARLEGLPSAASLHLCLIENITERKQSEEELRESERSKSVFLSHIPGMAYRCLPDAEWTMEYVSAGCYHLTGYEADALLHNKEVSYEHVIAPDHRQTVRHEISRGALERRPYHCEYEIETKSGERKWVFEHGQAIYDEQGQVEFLEGIILDASEQKQREAQISYLSTHDLLTGLYNRRRMETERQRLDDAEFYPLSVMICDIDGLRVINDAYGYDVGDSLVLETARIIRSCLRKTDIIGHVGGGEFMLLLPQTDNHAAQHLSRSIAAAVEKHNSSTEYGFVTVSLSLGYSTKDYPSQSMDEVIKNADNYLKNRKLLNQHSTHSAIVGSIMATMYAKSQETEEHGQRLGELSLVIGREMGLTQQSLDDLELLSKLHDIGKIGIDDRILNKPGALTDEEWQVMKKHPEIGYRIAMSTPRLEHIAEYILHHHERWDGSGYPAGLTGVETPLVSRILAVVDAFDAMTGDRVYRKALSREAAIAEIERCSGTQFDPHVATLFINLVNSGAISI